MKDKSPVGGLISVSIPKSAAGLKLSDWLRNNGYEIFQPCGGRGVCGGCRVMTSSGDSVYACRTICPADGMTVLIPSYNISHGEVCKKISDSISFGIAYDIGTTTLAAALVDIKGGNVLFSISRLNPQMSFGADVMTRITACRDGHLPELNAVIIRAMREMAYELILAVFPDNRTPCMITVAGNPTMLHIFLNISPEGMGAYPFTPAYTGTVIDDAGVLGFPDCKMAVLPSASAFIGSDITGGVLVTGMGEMDKSSPPCLLADIGTNGELVLSCSGTLTAVSAAAGPALEGAGISCGMGGVGGAVCRVRSVNGSPVWRTVDSLPARGICGSGLVDLTAYLLSIGELDESGFLTDGSYTLSGIHEGYDSDDDAKITITQRDIRELQLAKSAICAGMLALLDRKGVKPEEIGTVYVAGGLGYYLDMANAVRVGMLPRELLSKLVPVGNTSLSGAVRCLTDNNALDKILDIAEKCGTFELNSSSVFNEEFMSGMGFPEF